QFFASKGHIFFDPDPDPDFDLDTEQISPAQKSAPVSHPDCSPKAGFAFNYLIFCLNSIKQMLRIFLTHFYHSCIEYLLFL
ncbi:MAG: hypothetical protein ACLFRF_10570, partial [Desulfobacterales bacterium]